MYTLLLEVENLDRVCKFKIKQIGIDNWQFMSRDWSRWFRALLAWTDGHHVVMIMMMTGNWWCLGFVACSCNSATWRPRWGSEIGTHLSLQAAGLQENATTPKFHFILQGSSTCHYYHHHYYYYHYLSSSTPSSSALLQNSINILAIDFNQWQTIIHDWQSREDYQHLGDSVPTRRTKFKIHETKINKILKKLYRTV